MFKRNLPTKIEKTYNDNLGRLTYVCTTIYDTKLAFVAIYAQTIFEKNFYHSVMQELLTLSEYKLIIGGDMNAVCDLTLDRSTATFSYEQQQASSELNNIIDNLNLIDIWRIHNPDTRDYTCFSARQQSFSRIDYFLLSQSLKECTVNS